MPEDDPVSPELASEPMAAVTDNRCRECGVLTGTLAQTCVSCLDKKYLAEILRQQRAILSEHPATPLWVARDRVLIPHLILLGNEWMGWCGKQPLHEPRYKRRRTLGGGPFPPDLCLACRKTLHLVTEGMRLPVEMKEAKK